MRALEKVWLQDYTPTFLIMGYIKECYLVYGMAWLSTGQGLNRCRIGDTWYVSPGFDGETGQTASGGWSLFFKDE